jgi:hypothetical protein
LPNESTPDGDKQQDKLKKKKQEAKDVTLAGELLQVWWLIPLGITNLIARGKVKPDSIAKPLSVDAVNLLSPGQIVVLYMSSLKAIISCPDASRLGTAPAKDGDVSLHQEDARLLVADAANDMVGLYHPRHRKFLMIDERGNLAISSLPVVSMDDQPRGHESFYFEKVKG